MDFTGCLAHGVREDDWLQRTGPHVPPLTFPGNWALMCTENAKKQLGPRFPELRFRSVRLAKGVRSDWEKWNPEDPSIRVDGYDAVIHGKHDPTLEMPAFFELEMAIGGIANYDDQDKVVLTGLTSPSADFFLGQFPGVNEPFVTGDGRIWLEENGLADWLRFEETRIIGA